MKVRWMEGSLRLRITPCEFSLLQQGGSVCERATFPGGWQVCVGPGEESALVSDSLTVTLSRAFLDELSRPEAEGVYFVRENYRFFVEKDFPCVHPRPKEAQESTETFAPPPGFAERHKTVCT